MRSSVLLSERPSSSVILAVCGYMVEPHWNPILGIGARIVVASLGHGDVLACPYCSFKYWSPPFACTGQKMYLYHSSLVIENLSTETLRTNCCSSKIRTTALSIVISDGRHLAFGLATVSSRARVHFDQNESVSLQPHHRRLICCNCRCNIASTKSICFRRVVDDAVWRLTPNRASHSSQPGFRAVGTCRPTFWNQRPIPRRQARRIHILRRARSSSQPIVPCLPHLVVDRMVCNET